MPDYVTRKQGLKPTLSMKMAACAILLLPLFLTAVFFVSCFHNVPETTEIRGYELYSFEQGFAHFSFEKPKDYFLPEENGIKIQDNDYEWLLFWRNLKLSPGIGYAQSINILIIKISPEHPNASAEVESTIAEKKRRYHDFVLLERSFTSVDGIPAEQIVWSFGAGSSSTSLPKATVITPTLVRDVYFEHDGFIWNIGVSSRPLQNEAEQAKADFEHILQTFKILD